MKYKTPLVVLITMFILVTASFNNVNAKNNIVHIEGAPGPIAKIASGANGDLAWPGAGLSGSFEANISLSSGFVPADSLIVVYGATGHNNFTASMNVNDNGGTIYTEVEHDGYLLTQGFPSAAPEHIALRKAWYGVTTTSVSNVLVSSTANSSNRMWYLWGAANVYINANTVGLPTKVNISAQTYLASKTTTVTNSWLFWGAFVLLESATAACPQNGYNTGNVSGGSTENTYITSNNTLGETQVPFKYADRCVTPDLGIAVFDTHGPIPAPVTTFYWEIHQYAAFNNMFMIALEIKWVATPPVVQSLPSTNVEVNKATINGALNSLGSDSNVTVGFLWSTNYSVPKDSRSNNITIGSKTVIGNFSRQIFGLSSNVTYYYRVWAIFSGGYVNSGITNFTTPKFQPLPQNLIFGFILLAFVTFMILFFMFVFWVRRRRGLIQ